MKLSIPFVPDKKYTFFLKNNIQNIESVYFPLHSGPVLDSRKRFKKVTMDLLSQRLQSLTVKKYCLLNTRFIHPDLYHDTKFLNNTLDKLEFLASHNLTGIVFSDAYFLNALSATKRDIVSVLEAVPGINCMIDSSKKAFAFFELIEQSGFKMPGKLVLDRSLNREIKQLGKVSKEIKKNYPHIKIELLANEGCIDLCPFKLAHDSQISFSNTRREPMTKDKTFVTNQKLGCHAYFFKAPEKFLKSPFIRPEDINKYEKIADTIKLCGRTLGINFLCKSITSYMEESYKGNLFDLMDAGKWLSDFFCIENKKIDPDFFNLVTSCTKDCKNCNICRDIFKRAASKQPLKIKNYEDYL